MKLPQSNSMARKAVDVLIFVLVLCFFGFASATYCKHNSDCYNDGECCVSESCTATDCPSITGAHIAGIAAGLVIGTIVLSIVICCCCNCPSYLSFRSMNWKTLLISSPERRAGYQPLVSPTTTRHTDYTNMTIQHPPVSRYNTLPAGYNPPPEDCNFNPPPIGGYTDYSQSFVYPHLQAQPYPLLEGQALASHPPPQGQAPYI